MEYLKIIIGALAPYSLDATLIILVLGMIIFLIISIKSRSNISFKLGPFGFSLGGKPKNLNNMAFIYSLLEFQENHIRNIFQIESALLKKQMNYCEQKILEIKYFLCENYVEVLSKKLNNNEDVKSHRDYRFYQRITAMFIKEVADNIFFPAFMENHFENMSEEIWEKYVNDKSVYVLNFGEDLLGTIYEDFRLVTRKEASDSEKSAIPKTKEVVKSIFNMARTYAINSKKEIDNLRLNSKEEIKKICIRHSIDIESEEKKNV